MAKTIQVRVDDQLKDSADTLFSSLGLDTSTAIRIFLVASLQARGIPFSINQSNDGDAAVRKAIDYRLSGGEFMTAEQSLEYVRNALTAGAGNGN